MSLIFELLRIYILSGGLYGFIHHCIISVWHRAKTEPKQNQQSKPTTLALMTVKYMDIIPINAIEL